MILYYMDPLKTLFIELGEALKYVFCSILRSYFFKICVVDIQIHKTAIPSPLNLPALVLRPPLDNTLIMAL